MYLPGECYKGLFQTIQQFEEKAGLMVADSLISVKQGENCLKVLNMQNQSIKIYHDSKIARYTDLRSQI